MLFAVLFLILNKAFSVAVHGVYELLQDILLRDLQSEFKINFPGKLVHFEGRLIYRTKKMTIIEEIILV